MEAVAENESLNLSENVKWGHCRRFEQGKTESIPNSHHYGLTKTKHGWLEVVEQEVLNDRRLKKQTVIIISTLFLCQHDKP